MNNNNYINSNQPFVSTPISSERNFTPVDSQQRNQDNSWDWLDGMENQYPEMYHEIYPLVANEVNSLIESGYTPTTEMINSIVDNIIQNSGMWDEDEDMPEAIPTQAGFGRNPHFRRRRRHHNRNTLRDIIRILFIRDLFDRRGHRPRPNY